MNRHLQRLALLLFVAALVPAARAADSTISTSNRWVWSAGAGWINCRTDSTNGAVIGDYVLSGYWYSPSAGWIHLGNGAPTNGLQYSNGSADDYGVNHDSQGHLSGYAWCASSGWINFGWTNDPASVKAPKMNLQSGMFSGFAWGGSLGWISLSNLSAKFQTVAIDPGPDLDHDGIPDAWEIDQTGATNIIGGSADTDDDGMDDDMEYAAGTSPTNASDLLAMTTMSLAGTNLEVRWSSKLARLYRVEMNSNLLDSAAWADCGLGILSPDSDTETFRIFGTTGDQTFYRVRAIRPLSY